MERKVFPAFVTKVDADQGVVEHVVAVMGNVDMGGDVIHPGAFVKTIAERGTKIRCLDQHNTDSIMRVIGKPLAMREIGRNELPEQVLSMYPSAAGGLWVQTQYLLSTPEGKGAFERIKAGAVDEYSIGYDALDVDYSKVTVDGKEITVRNLRTIKLWEYSAVIWGMNPATSTLSAKSHKSTPERKPWDVFEMDGQYCVYKLDDDGERTGESLGCHDSEADARQQVEALYANEKAKAHPVENKAVNLTQMIQQVYEAFYQQYPDVYDRDYNYHLVYYVTQVWDEFVIVRQEGSAGNHLWKIAYTMGEDNTVNFAAPQDWTEVTMVYLPLSVAQGLMAYQFTGEAKAGRVLAARNAQRILSAMQLLQEAMVDAGLMDGEDDEEDEDKSVKQPGEKAGPGAANDAPPTSDQLRLIEIELEELSML